MARRSVFTMWPRSASVGIAAGRGDHERQGRGVSGIVLMLKGASGREVVDAVKAKIACRPESAAARPGTGSLLTTARNS